MPRKKIPLEARFQRGDSCWLWNGPRDACGYGTVKDSGRTRSAHRVIYEREVGPIPDGLELDHLCRVRHCVNPAHLEPVTHAENQRRAAAAQTHCKRDHEFTPENTYRWRGRRACRTCRRNYQASHRKATQ